MLAAESARLRELRLAALLADPDAFGATYERDAAASEEWWQDWAAQSESGERQRTFVLADEHDRWCGLGMVRHHEERSGVAIVTSMWIAPEARGRGCARLLCDACAVWAKQHGLDELTLSVVVGNEPGLRAYLGAGFEIRGQTTWVRDERVLDVITMSRNLSENR